MAEKIAEPLAIRLAHSDIAAVETSLSIPPSRIHQLSTTLQKRLGCPVEVTLERDDLDGRRWIIASKEI